jgi:hypothetical protein
LQRTLHKYAYPSTVACSVEARLVVPRITRRSGGRLARTDYAACSLWLPDVKSYLSHSWNGSSTCNDAIPPGSNVMTRRCRVDKGILGERSAGTSAKGRRGSHESLSQLYFLQIFPTTTKLPTHDTRCDFTFTTMADVDEDASHLRAPDAADYDPTEEAQDFLKLDKLTYAFTCPLALLHLADSGLTEPKTAHILPFRNEAKRTLRVMRRISSSTHSRLRAGQCTASSRGSAHTHKKVIS